MDFSEFEDFFRVAPNDKKIFSYEDEDEEYYRNTGIRGEEDRGEEDRGEEARGEEDGADDDELA